MGRIELDIPGDRAVLLLVGLPQIKNTLGLSIHESLRQRINMNYNIYAFLKEESRSYIEWKFKKAGCMESLFDKQAIEAVVKTLDGTARVINRLCRTAMVIVHSQVLPRLTPDIGMQDVNECTLG